MSNNHQFIAFSDRVVKRYAKTVLYRVSGYRLDPNRPENQLNFILATPEHNVTYTAQEEGRPLVHQTAFTYEDEVLELYSELEVKVFERLNRRLIEKGLIKEYRLSAPKLNIDNMLSDEEVDEIAGIRQITALKKRLSTITSIISLNRIKSAAIDLNRSVNMIKSIEARIDELSGANKTAS